MGGNTDRLHGAGLIEEKRVPDEFYAFIEELSDEEVTVLIGIKERLDEAGIPVQTFKPPHAAMPVL